MAIRTRMSVWARVLASAKTDFIRQSLQEYWQPATIELANIRTLMLWTRNFHLLYCFATWIEPRIRREAAE
jgi:hypothetical protein